LEAMFRLQKAWVEILAGRLAEARSLVDGVLREHPNLAPARKAARVVFASGAKGR